MSLCAVLWDLIPKQKLSTDYRPWIESIGKETKGKEAKNSLVLQHSGGSQEGSKDDLQLL